MMGSLNIIYLLSILSIAYTQIVDKGPSAESIRRVQELRQILKKHETHLETPWASDDLYCSCTQDACDSDIVAIAGKNFSGICRVKHGGACGLTISRKGLSEIEFVHKECFDKDELQPPGRPFQCQTIKASKTYTYTEKECCYDDMCNDREITIPTKTIESSEGLHWYMLLLFFVAVFFSAVGLIVGVFWCRNEKSKTYFRGLVARFIHRAPRAEDDILISPKCKTQLDKFLDDLEVSSSTGSGAGAPMLAHRTIARQIQLGTCIGKGRFGEVFIGEWKGEKVAVKIFISRDEKSWSRETEVYQTNMLRHSNLLRWIASDNKDTGTLTQLWLVTEYLPLGSLYDYLEKNTLSTTIGVQMLRSIAHGLSYLHAEVPGVNNQCIKPAIAHRDLKTKNILIKNDMTCAIADLGLAVRYMNGEIDIPENSRGGTVRYLAPEFLDETMVTNRFNSYVNLDIYALALVFWEVARRMEYSLVAWGALPYEPPYFEFVPRDPTIEEMRQCVCVEGHRPTIPDDWKNSGAMIEITRIVQECWANNPNSRHTALNIRCSLDKFAAAEKLKMIS